MPDSPVLYLALLGLVVGVSAWAGWSLGARRRRDPTANPPSEVWLCDGCRSYNEPARLACYACHRPRTSDARTVAPDPVFRIDQHIGRPFEDGGRGTTRPWLGADEPLLDDWLAARHGDA